MRALGGDWAPNDVSGILVTKRNRSICSAMPVSEHLCPLRRMCQKSWREIRGPDGISLKGCLVWTHMIFREALLPLRYCIM
jgi:hypothetical protein